jgi:hypothetical protein
MQKIENHGICNEKTDSKIIPVPLKNYVEGGEGIAPLIRNLIARLRSVV